MPLLDIFRAVRDQTSDPRNSFRANNEKLGWRFMEVFARMWDLGFTVRALLPRTPSISPLHEIRPGSEKIESVPYAETE
jgi:hypothetical protein